MSTYERYQMPEEAERYVRELVCPFCKIMSKPLIEVWDYRTPKKEVSFRCQLCDSIFKFQ